MTDRELMQQALDVINFECGFGGSNDYDPKAIANALRDRLAQPEPVTGNLLKDAYNAMVAKKTRSQKLREAGFTRRPKGWEKEKDEQEPVAWMVYTQDGQSVYVTDNPTDIQERQQALPLYTTPPQRPWVGLTEEDYVAINASCLTKMQAAASTESMLREKNT